MNRQSLSSSPSVCTQKIHVIFRSAALTFGQLIGQPVQALVQTRALSGTCALGMHLWANRETSDTYTQQGTYVHLTCQCNRLWEEPQVSCQVNTAVLHLMYGKRSTSVKAWTQSPTCIKFVCVCFVCALTIRLRRLVRPSLSASSETPMALGRSCLLANTRMTASFSSSSWICKTHHVTDDLTQAKQVSSAKNTTAFH